MQPWLWLPARLTHKLAPFALSFYGQRHPFQTLTWKSMTWRGLHFPNRLGLAAGVDKNADNISDWWTLGPGFVEIGTVTPKAQNANPGKVVDRDEQRFALWNRLGFPSVGAKKVRQRVERLKWPHFTPVFINVGRNRTTPNDKAAEDYVSVMLEFKDCADAFVINISSPNTQGLRDLQKPETLRAFLKSILDKVHVEIPREKMPILLKLSPDLTEDELRSALDVSLDCNIDGWILTNTTLSRETGMTFPQEGGVSGKPLTSKSERMLEVAVAHLSAEAREGRILISCGGVMTPEDVFKRIDMGADLVQCYTALIYRGPFFFREVQEAATDRGWNRF